MADWFNDTFAREFDKQAQLLGRFNLGIFGKTGVGKSTLINAVFGEQVATTGIGEPVTQASHLYIDKRGTLGLIDSKGLEIGRDDADLLKDLEKSVKEMRKRPLPEQIHAAWYCVRGMDRRFEHSEADFIRKLDELDIPTLMIFTQVPMRDGQFHPDAVELARKIIEMDLPIVEGKPFMTFAMRDQFTDQPPYGLINVLQATFRVVPEAVQQALACAQEVDLRLKAREAHRVIATATGAAAAAALVPIPLSDAALLVPIQLGMMARIAQLYKIKVERAAMMAVASTSIATAAGRATFTSLLKFIPGAGSMAGGAISAGVASTFTAAMGEAWLAVCQAAASGFLNKVDGVLDQQAVKDLFNTEMKKRLPTINTDPK